MKILELKQIKTIIKKMDLIPIIENAFVAYSSGKAVIPPVGELLFEKPPGDVHIKYGYIRDDDVYVIKVASGFYENKHLNLPSSNGLMLIFSQHTGILKAILLDQGYLTDIRTAVAGAIAAKYCAPREIKKIGIIGSGTQAKLQLEFLQKVTPCKSVMVWSRDNDSSLLFKKQMEKQNFIIEVATKTADVAHHCNLIVTTTPSTTPLLNAKDIQPGTHITAVGTDSPNKQELEEKIFHKANLVVVDSKVQCLERGDTAHAYRKQLITEDKLLELGQVIQKKNLDRKDRDISVTDLTGVAVQDIAIAEAVYDHDAEVKTMPGIPIEIKR